MQERVESKPSVPRQKNESSSESVPKHTNEPIPTSFEVRERVDGYESTGTIERVVSKESAK